jgi:hypothetical protein
MDNYQYNTIIFIELNLYQNIKFKELIELW